MKYAIRHVTRFDYSAAVRESFMEVRKHPRSDLNQQVRSFSLSVVPQARVFHHTDYLDNIIHTFDIPRPHTRLMITADAFVELIPPAPLPDRLPPDTWARLDSAAADGDFWDMLAPSHFVQSSPLVAELAAELGIDRRCDPLCALRELNQAIYTLFDYVPNSTAVDSPIDEALANRAGVCQDFTHIMLALGRGLGIPCRYVSGYLYTGKEDHDRSAEDASHAWIEAWLPGLGWIGFDPTNNLLAGERHIRVAIGRDYADVPPTHGIFRGEAESQLSVGVQVKITDDLPFEDNLLPSAPPPAISSLDDLAQQEQQQQ
jgi:transglutaminase-like putative cysteine protease